MKLSALLLCGLAALSVFGATGQDLQQVRTVYLLPMGNGFDQHLANRLTGEGVLQVVTDPLQADAVFTDRLGPELEKRLEDMDTRAAEAARKAAEGDIQEEDPAEEERPARAVKPVAGPAAGTVMAPRVVPFSSFGRAKGTFFLVDRKSRAVLWSIYERPRDASADQLHRSAGRVVDRFRRDLSGR